MERRGACGGKGGSGGRRGVALNCALGLFLANALGLCCLFASSCRERACECACARRGARMCGLAPAARVHSKNITKTCHLSPIRCSPRVQPTYPHTCDLLQPQHKHTSAGPNSHGVPPHRPARTRTHSCGAGLRRQRESDALAQYSRCIAPPLTRK
eukprot:scaffold7923_cov121-Isochrysis_galbana.AAC.9